MPVTAERKNHPLSMRLPEADLAIIDRAAGLHGRSRTDFVREAAVRAAEEVLIDQRLVKMSREGFAAFQDVISSEPAIVSEIVELASRTPPWSSDRKKE